MFEIYFFLLAKAQLKFEGLCARACTRVNIMPAGNYSVFYVSSTHVCAYLCACTHLRAKSIRDAFTVWKHVAKNSIKLYKHYEMRE